MDVDEVKKLIGITTTKHDVYLTATIPLLIDFVRQYCRQSFTGKDGNDALPGGVKLFIAKAAEYNMQKAGVTSRSMGDVSHSFYVDFPESIKTLLRPYKKVGFVRG